METNMQNLAQIIAAVVWADNEYDEQEKQVVVEIAEDLNLDTAALTSAVDDAVTEFQNLNEDDANYKLLAAVADVAEGEQHVMLGVAIEMALADGVVTRGEIETIFGIAGSLGIEEAEATLMIVDKVRDEECYKVEY